MPADSQKIKYFCSMTPEQSVGLLLKRDHFTRWLGLEIDKTAAGYCKLHFTVKTEMLNGFGSIHGGVVFSASDSALAFAANSHGSIAVALDVSITFTRPAKEGDLLYVEATETHLGNKTAVYEIRTTNAVNELVALFKGIVYRTGKEIPQ
jgi:acyl-CoA thioesterase